MTSATLLIDEAVAASEAVMAQLRWRLETMRSSGSDTEQLMDLARFWRSVMLFEFDLLRTHVHGERPLSTATGPQLTAEEAVHRLAEKFREALGMEPEDDD